MTELDPPNSVCILLFGDDLSERHRRRQQLRGFELVDLGDPASLCQAIAARRGDVLVVCAAELPAEHLLDVHRLPLVCITADAPTGSADVVLPPTTGEQAFRECVQLLGRRSQVLDELEQLSARLQQAFSREGWVGRGRWHGPHELMAMALTDPLTGIFGRRHFEESLRHEFDRARSRREPLSLLLIDLDQFKPVNDTRGHYVGDMLLKEVAQRLSRSTRTSDTVCRYGGDEFAVIAAGTAIDSAVLMAERLRTAVAGEPFTYNSQSIHIGCSIGIASLPESGATTAAEFVLRADQSLLAAKRAGGSRVCVVDKAEARSER